MSVVVVHAILTIALINKLPRSAIDDWYRLNNCHQMLRKLVTWFSGLARVFTSKM